MRSSDLHHAGGVVHHDHRAGAERRARLLHASRSPWFAVIITSPGTTGTETPPGITALSLRPPRTPPQISSRSLNGMPSGSSMFCGLFDVAGDREDHRAAGVRHAEIGEPLRALAQDRRHRGVALRVVDRRRLAVQAEVRGERRLEARPALLAFERFEQRRLFAADVRARADERCTDRSRRPSPACSCRAGRRCRLPCSASSKRGTGSSRNSPRM